MKLTIEKLVYGGEGLARVPGAEGRSQTVFVPFVLPGEEVGAVLAEQKKSFAHARLEEVITSSADRVPPPCPYFQQCGGCHYQHMSYPHQLQAKKTILLETLQRTAKIEWSGELPIHSAQPLHYRNRTRMRVSIAGGFAIGYHQYRSHRLVAVKQCPISSPLINRAVQGLWKIGEAGGFPGQMAELEFFANATDDELLLELLLNPEWSEDDVTKLESFARELTSELPFVSGFSAFAYKDGFPQYGRAVWQWGKSTLAYQTRDHSYRVSAGSFFQTNRFLSDVLIDLVTKGTTGKLALDLYAGTGLFSLPLANVFEQVIAVESAPVSFADLRANAPANLKTVRSSTEDYLRRPGEAIRPELVVVDPPRAGLGDKVVRALAAAAPREIRYVSCDPATLSRDLRVLVESGYRIGEIHLVDLFPQTFHLETVVKLLR